MIARKPNCYFHKKLTQLLCNIGYKIFGNLLYTSDIQLATQVDLKSPLRLMRKLSLLRMQGAMRNGFPSFHNSDRPFV